MISVRATDQNRLITAGPRLFRYWRSDRRVVRNRKCSRFRYYRFGTSGTAVTRRTFSAASIFFFPPSPPLGRSSACG